MTDALISTGKLGVLRRRTSGVRVRDSRGLWVAEYRGYDLHPDGDRFVIADVGLPVVASAASDVPDEAGRLAS